MTDSGDIEISFTNLFDLVWKDRGSQANEDVAFYHPKTSGEFHAVGHLAQKGYADANGKVEMLVVKDNSPKGDALKPPADYKPVWADHGAGAHMDGSIWQPVPPEGYVALGCVAQGEGKQGYKEGYTKPELDIIRCVREDLVVSAPIGEEMWSSRGSGAAANVSVWSIAGALFELGTFVATDSYTEISSHACANVLLQVTEPRLTPSGRRGRFKALPKPAHGHFGVMRQPEWIDSVGYFVFGDESIVYAMDASGNLIWAIEPRIRIYGYTIVSNDLYIQDGPVLCKYDMPLIDEGNITAPAGCDACVNTITDERFEAKEEPFEAKDAYHLNPEDAEKLERLQTVWKTRSWADVLTQAEAGKKNLERLPAQKPTGGAGGSYDAGEGLSRMIETIKDLLGSAAGDDEVLRQNLKQAEENAAHLRFAAPAIKSKIIKDDTAIYSLAADGTISAYTQSLDFVGRSRQTPPNHLALLLSQDGGKTTLKYGSEGAIITLSTDGSDLKKTDSFTPPNGTAKWMAAAMAAEKVQPSAQTLLEDGPTQAFVSLAQGNPPQSILFIMVDETAHQSSLRVLHTDSPLPRFEEGKLKIAPPGPMPEMKGGRLYTGKDGRQPIRVIAAPASYVQREASYVYLVAELLPSDFGSSKTWKKGERELEKTLKQMQSSQADKKKRIKEYPPSELQLRSLRLLRYKPDHPITTDLWQSAWSAYALAIESEGRATQAADEARQNEVNAKSKAIKFVTGLFTFSELDQERKPIRKYIVDYTTANSWADRSMLELISGYKPKHQISEFDHHVRADQASAWLREQIWEMCRREDRLLSPQSIRFESIKAHSRKLAKSSNLRDEAERNRIAVRLKAQEPKEMLKQAFSETRMWAAWQAVESEFFPDNS